MIGRDRLLALVEAEKGATPGPWSCEVTTINDLHAGAVTMPLLAGPDTYGPGVADTQLIAASRNLAPALAEVVLSLSPEDEGMVERVAEVLHKSLCPNRCLYVERPVPHARLAQALLSALRAYADEKIGEAG